KAGEMALQNNWDENAYQINMAILEEDCNNCAAYTRLAKYYKLNSNIEEARNMYMRVLEIEPENRGANNNINDLDKEKRENEYIEKVKGVTELLKEGHSSMVKERYRYATKLLTRAYSMDSSLNNAVLLAAAYKKSGRHDMVVELHEKLVKTSSDETEVRTINREFRQLLMKEMSLVE
ncbi:MAG: hypothetical protein HGA22_03275, partial [Clostridiales bacterium]|nr:hypothetical protein [Clostridiales bacterium]